MKLLAVISVILIVLALLAIRYKPEDERTTRMIRAGLSLPPFYYYAWGCVGACVLGIVVSAIWWAIL